VDTSTSDNTPSSLVINTADGTRVVLTCSKSMDLVIEHHGHRSEFMPAQSAVLKVDDAQCSLADAVVTSVDVFQRGDERGISFNLSLNRKARTKTAARLVLEVAVELSSSDVIFRVIPDEDSAIKMVDWPPPFAAQAVPSELAVVPIMQGCVIPGNWGAEVTLDKVWPYSGRVWTRGLYMPWWGQIRANHGYMAIFETPYDASIRLQHPAGGPTSIGARWLPSKGALRYPRVVRYRFFDRCNHVTMTKNYREWVAQKGMLRTLAEKSVSNSRVSSLRGTGVIHTGILYHVQPSSPYYTKVKNTHDLHTFIERGEQLKELARRGFENLYVHLDGWGQRGYDNLHPDILPPCQEAGGWMGLRRLAAGCRSIGYNLALHDQYRDYYHDADTYDSDLAVRDSDGRVPTVCEWYGGPQSFLCARIAKQYLKRNLADLRRQDIPLSGIYLDVFAVADLDECYHPSHPMDREECARARCECFALARSEGLIVSSEEPTDFALPFLDLVHHAPYAKHPSPEGGRPLGIPTPLFSLVYHDCLVVPWTCIGRGGWGIPDQDLGMLHALLNGGVPYVSLTPSQEETAIVETVRSLHQKVGWQPITNHEFLDGSYRVQQTTFADGTRVMVDFATDDYKIMR